MRTSATAPAATPPRRPAAGRRPALQTPFGTVFATNITPDPETGIGAWSREAFERAMRDGIARDGEQLYPAFPYDHFTHATDAELDALYACLMTRRPVAGRAPANRLDGRFGFRPLVAAWNLLYLREGPLPTDPATAADWNRGRVLAEGLAHCGGCHTPRNGFGAEDSARLRRRLDRRLVRAAAQRALAGRAAVDARRALRLSAHRARHDPRGSGRPDGRRHARAGPGAGRRRARHRRLRRLPDGRRAGRRRTGRRSTRAVADSGIPRPPRCSPAPAPPATSPARR